MKIIQEEWVSRTLPRRRPEDHKGRFGTLLCVCGSERYPGAALLCTRAALRSGAGIVTLAASYFVTARLAGLQPECTFLPLKEGSGPRVLEEEIQQRATALAVGCGLGTGEGAAAWVRIALGAECPLVLDADGLNLLARQPGQTYRRQNWVVTPHPGEMARLLHTDVHSVQGDRAAAARLFAQKSGAVTVLKGAGTLIASPQGDLWKNETGNPGLAKGGSGDLLTGIIGAFLAQGMSPLEAALCGVYLHGAAADRCAARLSQAGMLPGDILTDLCALFLQMGR